MAGEMALRDRLKEALHLGILTACQHFHTAVGKIANPSGDLEPLGQRKDGGTEADTLDFTLVSDADGDHGRIWPVPTIVYL
jgi:hypothetical protein